MLLAEVVSELLSEEAALLTATLELSEDVELATVLSEVVVALLELVEATAAVLELVDALAELGVVGDEAEL